MITARSYTRSRRPTIDEQSRRVHARRIAAARIAVGLTQAELAERAGVSERTVQHWESGKTIPQLAKLEQIARVLGMDLSDEDAADEAPTDDTLDDLRLLPGEVYIVAWAVANALMATTDPDARERRRRHIMRAVLESARIT